MQAEITQLNNPYKINKRHVEWFCISILFMLSFMNSIALLAFLAGLLVLLYQGIMGAVKIVSLVIFRTIINEGIAIKIEEVQELKWLILFLCAGIMLLALFKSKKMRFKLRSVIILSLLFFVYNVFVAFAFSSLPIVATAKAFSYCFIFLGVVSGIGYTWNQINWISWHSNIFNGIIVLSLLFSPFPVAYLRNGVSLQGIVNQPNMLGIMCVLALSLTLNRISGGSKSKLLYMMIPLTFWTVILSRSRTALISLILILLIFLIVQTIMKLTYLKISLLSFLFILFILALPFLGDSFKTFLYKGQENGDLLYSREEQLATLLNHFNHNPWFGTGFSVPYLQGRYYGFSMDFVVESGNIILALLAYGGIIGFALFGIFAFVIFLKSEDKFLQNSVLFLAPFLICMGEMVFFSSNSIGVFCYVFLALYMFDTSKSSDHIRNGFPPDRKKKGLRFL